MHPIFWIELLIVDVQILFGLVLILCDVNSQECLFHFVYLDSNFVLMLFRYEKNGYYDLNWSVPSP